MTNPQQTSFFLNGERLKAFKKETHITLKYESECTQINRSNKLSECKSEIYNGIVENTGELSEDPVTHPLITIG